MIGGVLGSYRVLKELGRGGMGAVFLAEHTLIGKRAAAKILLPQFSRDPEIVNRFFNEAKAATQIRHPGIVEIFDFGYHESGCAYLVMEFLEGESLSMRLLRDGGKFAEPWLIEVARQVASALRAAHDKGIVHRDLKPDNVFVVPDPDLPMGARLKVLDFGIAKLSGEGETSMKTRTGAVIGTPAYMSPEQCRGAGQVDWRSDIYSLGCLMYEMACGHPPFLGEGPGDIIGSHIFAPVPAVTVPLSPALSELIVRMLQKTAGARPQSMAEVIGQLEAIGGRSSGRQRSMTPAPSATSGGDARTLAMPPTTTLGGAASEISEVRSLPGSRSRGWLVPVGILFVGAAAGAGWFFTRPQQAAPINVSVPAAAPPEAPEKKDEAPKPEAPKAGAPAQVHLSIDSEPSGADVYRAADGVRVGKTPLTEELPRAGGQAEYLLKLHGYHEERVVLSTERDLNKIVALEKLAPAKPAAAASSKPTASKPAAATKPAAAVKKPPAAKPVKNGVLDPFEN
jgi:eukaryotic-like serine/threonine-protein kinase